MNRRSFIAATAVAANALIAGCEHEEGGGATNGSHDNTEASPTHTDGSEDTTDPSPTPTASPSPTPTATPSPLPRGNTSGNPLVGSLRDDG